MIEEHYLEETLTHAKIISEERKLEREAKAKEHRERIRSELVNKQTVSEYLKAKVGSAQSYFELELTDKEIIEDLESWIRGTPLSSWTSWHLETAQFLEDIPQRTKALSLIRLKTTTEGPVAKWEYLSVTVRIKGASGGLVSAFMGQGLEYGALDELQSLGNVGWEIVSAAPIVYGAVGSTSTSSLVILLKRPKH